MLRKKAHLWRKINHHSTLPAKQLMRSPLLANQQKQEKIASRNLVDSWKEKGFSSLIMAAPELDYGAQCKSYYLIYHTQPLLQFIINILRSPP
ncbi:E3 ubiquitin-protein ligase MIB2 [Bienertia sinuspersici]